MPVSECFHRVSATLYVSLAPMFSASPAAGIKSQHLDPLLMTWYGPVSGVLLAYQNVRLLGQSPDNSNTHATAKIIHESPFAFSWVSADFLVWRPARGDLVEGSIRLQAPSHISLLVHDVFHASVRREALPDGWRFVYHDADEAYYEGDAETASAVEATAAPGSESDKSLGYWVDGAGEKVADKVQFYVKKVAVTGRLVSLQGTLRADGSTRAVEEEEGPGYTEAKHIKFDDEPLQRAAEPIEASLKRAAEPIEESLKRAKVDDVPVDAVPENGAAEEDVPEYAQDSDSD